MFKKIISNISLKLRLTVQEIKTIFFILLILILGLSVKYANLKIPEKTIENSSFNFFENLDKAIENQKITQLKQNKIMEKRVDSEQELSDFSVNKLDSNKKDKFSLKEQSLNLNTVSRENLITLPGIGPKTADKIIELRNSKKRFKDISDLLEVKGIGSVKLRAIKKYLYIENKNSNSPEGK